MVVEIAKSWKCSAGILPPLHTTSFTCSLTVPSSVCTGWASFDVTTSDFHPGRYAGCAPMKPGGNCTATFDVLAFGSSLGTRSVMVGNDPAGSVLGCRLTCAPAGAGSATAATTATSNQAILLDMRNGSSRLDHGI